MRQNNSSESLIVGAVRVVAQTLGRELLPWPHTPLPIVSQNLDLDPELNGAEVGGYATAHVDTIAALGSRDNLLDQAPRRTGNYFSMPPPDRK
jgi:hypothetical protein